MDQILKNKKQLPTVAERETGRKKIIDPEGPLIRACYWISLITGSLSASAGFLFLYILGIDHHNKCLDIDYSLAIALCVLRSVLDFLYFPCIIVSLITSMEDPKCSSFRVFFRICVELYSILPLPQLQFFGGFAIYHTERHLISITVTQSLMAIARVLHCMRSPTRLWPAAIYVYFCTLLNQYIGASWYFLSIVSVLHCWAKVQKIHWPFPMDDVTCGNLDINETARLGKYCSITSPFNTFDYGIYTAALESGIVESTTNFCTKWLYSFFWALRNLSSFGQNLETSTYFNEIVFATGISIVSLLWFTWLLGSIQNWVRYTDKKSEEKKIKEKNTELWMSHENVPKWLRKRIKQYEDYKWESNWFVEEETLIHNLPKGIRKDLKRHLCWALVTKVPQFTRLMLMDPDFLHALCDRLKPVFYIKKTCILHEGKSLEEMIFIKQGNLRTKAKDTQRPGSYIFSNLKDGDFCGEELVTWALNPNSSSDHILPISTKTVETISKVKAYALSAVDLKFIASQLPTSYTSRLRDWPRTRAARTIQKAWSRHRQTRLEQSLSAAEASSQGVPFMAVGTPSPAGSTSYAPRAANVLRTRQTGESSDRLSR